MMKRKTEVVKEIKATRKELRTHSGQAMYSSYLEGYLDALKWVAGT